jgi:ATP-dependent Lon protease
MPFYTDQQKIAIAKDYLLPKALKDSGLDPQTLTIDPAIWEEMVRPLGFDGGIRSLKRNIDSLVRKISKRVVEGYPGPYQITHENLKQFMN